MGHPFVQIHANRLIPFQQDGWQQGILYLIFCAIKSFVHFSFPMTRYGWYG
jgi:hypothetical protein